MPSSSVETDNGVATAAAAVVPSGPAVDERLVSSLRTQAEVDFLCRTHGVPSGYTPRPAGDDRRACTPPPPGSVCVYAYALEAGMRVPLHGFFCEVLAHFGIAPAQLVPNAWRVMAGYLALCRTVGVPPSLAVFRRFFLLAVISHKQRGWYCLRARDSSGLRFSGMPNTPMDWRKQFFFLSSPESEPWPCPVEWGEPSQSSFLNAALTSEERRSAGKLLEVYGAGGATVDIKTSLCDGNPDGAMASAASTPSPPASSIPTSITSSCKGMDPSVYKMMKAMLAEKAAAQATAPTTEKVKAEPDSSAPGPPPLCGEKRFLDEANGEENPTSVVCPPPPGFPRKPAHFPSSSRNRGDTTDWKAARALLQDAIAPPQERVFAASQPSDVVRSSYAAILQAVNYTSFSLSYALELEEKLVTRDAEVAALRERLEEANAELAARANADAKWAAVEAELEKAVRHVLGSEEHVRRRAEHALDGYERWRGDSPAHATASPPTTLPMMQPGGAGGHKRRPEPSSKYDPKQWVL